MANNTSSVNTTTASPFKGAGQVCVSSQPVSRDLQVALYSLLLLLSAVGNCLIVFVVIRNKRMHTVANYLICNMSVADLLITFLPLVWEVIKLTHYPNGEWPMGQFMCTYVHMVIYLSVACSILSLFVITWDRFFAIMLPFKQIFTKKILPALIIVIWVASFAFASPTIYTMDLFDYQGAAYCVEIWKPPFDSKDSPMHYTVVLFVGLYAMPLLAMSIMYSVMGWKLWKRNIPGNRSTENEKELTKQKIKVIRMLVIVVSAFALCWMPIFIYQFMIFTDPYYKACPGSLPKSFVFFAFYMQYLASGINPYIYFTCSEAYRRGLKNALRRRRICPEVTLTLRTSTLHKKLSSASASNRQEMVCMRKKSNIDTIKEEDQCDKDNNDVNNN